ncbi:hypothetical protein KDL01_07555 [Actinospica durhamensis]|uniref:Uncharacterized protein n=1 Tax=Actinospica durhamensis TaxID=1508375 RepID=A0A941IMQ3_9ACTN|nr:hypothetical protein [Actinospica durhamensis]MBR7833114.1 hypothetical protein [Actinospica durhamensis]
MAVGRAERQAERRPRFQEVFGRDAGAALELIELVELAWHDCYDEITPPANVIEDIVVSSEGSLAKLISAARLAVTDARDLQLLAEDIRSGRGRRRN